MKNEVLFIGFIHYSEIRKRIQSSGCRCQVAIGTWRGDRVELHAPGADVNCPEHNATEWLSRQAESRHRGWIVELAGELVQRETCLAG